MYNGAVKAYETSCTECGARLVRANDRSIHFCNRKICKANWQRRAKPVSEEWLREKYLKEKLDCTQIAALVNRDPKSVWNWMKDLGIPTRKRGMDVRQQFPKGYRGRAGCKLTEKHKDQLREARKRDGRIPAYVNGVHWTKFYGRHGSTWKGGISPERQAFYATPEWADAVKSVWHRDDAFCQRCGLDHRSIQRATEQFHIHHIDSFMVRERRADVSNLLLLCDKCHRWIHSRKNTEKKYLGAGH